MKLIISHISAADFWRRIYPINRVPSMPAATPSASGIATSSEDVWQFAPQWVTSGFLQPENGVLHTLALNANRTYRTNTHVSHACKEVLPDGSLYALNDKVYVCAPELVFLQLAQSLELAQLIAYGCELCGIYCFDESSERGFRTRNRPLVTKAQLKSFVDSARGMRGHQKAQEALGFIAENAASPMEATCALLLTLPYRLGGYKLPELLLNTRINVTASLKSICPTGYCIADFRVPGTKFIIEYLGVHDHAGSAPMQNDRGRVVALREMGFDVLELTAKQVWSLDAFEIVAKRVSKESGKRIRSGASGATDGRVGLRKLLRSWNGASGRPLH